METIFCPASPIGNTRAEFQPGLFWFVQTHTRGSVTLINNSRHVAALTKKPWLLTWQHRAMGEQGDPALLLSLWLRLLCESSTWAQTPPWLSIGPWLTHGASVYLTYLILLRGWRCRDGRVIALRLYSPWIEKIGTWRTYHPIWRHRSGVVFLL